MQISDFFVYNIHVVTQLAARRDGTTPTPWPRPYIYGPYICILNIICVIHVLCCVLVDLRAGILGNVIKLKFAVKKCSYWTNSLQKWWCRLHTRHIRNLMDIRSLIWKTNNSDKYMYENAQMQATLCMPQYRTRQQIGYFLIGTKNHN